MQTIVKLYDDHDAAQAAVRELEAAGLGTDKVSLVRGNGGPATDTGEGSMAMSSKTDDGDATNAGVGATIGTLVGGGAGLLAGLGLLAIPGLGPVVAAGWLVAALTTAGVGAAAGGLVGALTETGVSEEDAHVYAEGVKRGGSLVTVRAEDSAEAARAEEILGRHMPVSVRDRESSYRQEGWSRHDATDTDDGAMAGRGLGAGGMGSMGATSTGVGMTGAGMTESGQGISNVAGTTRPAGEDMARPSSEGSGRTSGV